MSVKSTVARTRSARPPPSRRSRAPVRNSRLGRRTARRRQGRCPCPRSRRTARRGSARPDTGPPRPGRSGRRRRGGRASARGRRGGLANVDVPFIRRAPTSPGSRRSAGSRRNASGSSGFDSAELVHGLERLGARPEDPQLGSRSRRGTRLGGPTGSPAPECARESRCRGRAPRSARDRSRRTARSSARPRRARRGRRVASHRVHHGPDVVHARLERRPPAPVRHAGAALVEHDQPPERREPVRKPREARDPPRSSTWETYPGTKTTSNGPSPSTW